MLALSDRVNVRTTPLTSSSGLLDVGIVAGGFALVYACLRLLELPRAGSFAVLTALALSTWRLRVNGESWRMLGLVRPRSLGRMLLAIVALYAAVVASALIIIEPLAQALGWEALDVSAYASLRGNPIELAKILLIAWTSAAIGEELLFRGFLLTRLQTLLGNTRISTALVVILQAALFGVAHAYLGAKGVTTATLVGVIYGAWYVMRDRNLWPLIIAHGLTDTVSLLAIYAGALS
jgi:uncharacterized protein